MTLKRLTIYKWIQNVIKIFVGVCLVFILLASYEILKKPYDIKLTRQRLENNYHNVTYNYTKVDEVYRAISPSSNNLRNFKNDVTIVTAYFSLGSFRKGDSQVYTIDLYRKWAKIFKSLENHVIAYFDSVEFCDYFKVLRQHMPENNTKIIYVEREDLWAFQIQSQIKKVFSQAGYPQHNPNTIIPEYSCAMHAKYELMKRSIIENVFKTKYFSWVDIGLFRDLSSDKEPPFGIYVPNHFTENSVAYGVVRERDKTWRPIDIVYANAVWVCGCFFLGRADTLLRWTLEYMEGVEWLLKKQLMNTDQQVIYILVNSGLARTSIQEYFNDGGHVRWFHLGYLARDAWFKRKRDFLIT